MEINEQQPGSEQCSPELAPQETGILELGTASVETRGAIGFLEEFVTQFLPDGIDPN